MSLTSPESEDVDREISAGIITGRFAGGEREYLLLKHANGGHWSFPKGHVEEGEQPREAAIRELKEETGLAVRKFVPKFYEKTSYTFERNGLTVPKTVIYFLGTVSGDCRVELSPEHHSHLWLPYDDSRSRLTYENDRNLLDRADQELTGKEWGLDGT
jgi:8-oxo-dGTP pyrophosphatase MutT (NUDIX family)